MFGCKHQWEVKHTEVLKSKFDVAIKATENHADIEIPHQMCNATVVSIQILACTKCGKIKKFTTTN